MSWHFTLPNPPLPLIKGCNVESVTERYGAFEGSCMNAHHALCGWSFTYLILTTVAFYHLHLTPRASIPPKSPLSKVYSQGGKNCLQLCKAHSRSHAVFVHFFDYYIFSCLPLLFATLLFWAKEKRWHPDCCQASIVSSFLTFLWWEGGRVKSRDHVETAALPALSLFFYVHLLLSLLSVLPLCWPSLLLLVSFYFSFFSSSLSYHSLAFLFYSSTHAKMVSAILMKNLLNQWETVSNREGIVTASSI